MSPKISIIIPTFNRERYLAQAIESALSQDYENLEIIVMDNASTDSTAKIVKQYINDSRITYVVNENNVGMVRNWKKALDSYAKGDWFLILSDDDYLINNSYITRAVDLIRKDSGLVIVYANGYIKDESTGSMAALNIRLEEINEGKKVFLTRGSVRPQDFTLCNVLFNTKISNSLECFSNEFNVSCDSKLFLLLSLQGRVGFIRDKVSVYRVHSDNLVSGIEKNYQLFVNNWLSITVPYLAALTSGILTAQEQAYFEDKVLKRHIRIILMSALYRHSEKYREVEEKLISDIGDNTEIIFSVKRSIRFVVDSFILKNLRILYIFLKVIGKARKKRAFIK